MNCGFKSLPLVVTSLIAFCIFSAPAANAAIEGGNAKKGRELAKEQCKPCHVAGADGGTMTPLSKTQRQWQRFYDKNKHERLSPGTWDKISESDLKDIVQFMYDHAADSDQPETCGQ